MCLTGALLQPVTDLCPTCAAMRRASQLTAVTPKRVGLEWCKRLLTGCFKATEMGVGSDLGVVEWRKTLSFVLCFQSSIRASRGTIGGYFLAGRSMTWWPVSETRPSVPHGSKAIPGVRRAGLVRESSPRVLTVILAWRGPNRNHPMQLC